MGENPKPGKGNHEVTKDTKRHEGGGNDPDPGAQGRMDTDRESWSRIST